MKRLLDILVASAALVLLLPLMVLAALLIAIKLGRPVIFSQARPGLQGMVFRLYKFRSMSDACDSEGNLLPDEARLGSFGKRLRATSIDELPTLWNVLKGDMSLIGPRPLLVEYLPLYTDHQAQRHRVRPGITGWAQVNGRNSITWEQKFNLDVWYVQNQSTRLDLRILWMTVNKVIKRADISSSTSVTIERFQGSPESFRNSAVANDDRTAA